MICEALLLTRHFEEGLNTAGMPATTCRLRGRTNPFFDLWDEFASARRANPRKKHARELSRMSFTTLCRGKYGMMIGLLAEKKLGRLNKAKQGQFADLLKDTGFKDFDLPNLTHKHTFAQSRDFQL